MLKLSRLASLSIAATLLSGGAFAQEAVYELPQPAASSLSRAAVQADLAAARAAGTLQTTEADFQKLPQLASAKSRSAVLGEVLATGADALHAVDREPQGFDAPLAQLRPTAAPALMASLR
jgi:hypothetical protein